MNTGVFVCYAPADDPQIAIAVVVEKGGSGSALTTVAKDLMDVYFSSTDISETTATDNSLAK
jgi:penicillin-binding protein 2